MAENSLEHVISVEAAGTLDGLFRERVKRTPNLVAYRDYNHEHSNWRDYTWEQIDHQVARWQAALDKDGLKAGDRVGVMLRNSPEWVIFDQAALGLGLVVVPLYTQDRPDNVAYILNDSGCKVLLFGTNEQWATFGEVRGQLGGLVRILIVEAGAPADDARVKSVNDWLPGDGGVTRHVPRGSNELATIVYTSGTTGRPKGAMLSHRNLLVMILSYFADIDWLDQRDTMIHAAPMSHASGLYGLPFVARGGLHVIPDSGHFDPDELAVLFRSHANVTLFAAPTMLTRLIHAPALQDHDFANLKTIHYGGGPMYVADLAKAIDLFGPRLFQIYGQGESPCTITGLSKLEHQNKSHPRYLERLGSAGVARTDVEVRVVDAEDRTLPPGEIGEVAVRGDVVMAGYWANPEASRRSLRGGWLHTGDIGVFDGDGFLTLKDRANDMIISGGSNIYPREVEEVLLTHPGVLEAAVVGRLHPEWGEEVVAFVVARPGTPVNAADLDRLCLDHIARFKRPRRYAFVDTLPKNNYGKVLKTELRKRDLSD